MARQHHRHQAAGRLNLVSLMDIFTILVFFLMVNSSDVEVLPADKRIDLPESVSTQQPGDGVLLAVGRDFLAVAGEPVLNLADLDPSADGTSIPALVSALRAQPAAVTEQESRAVTIMGDRDIPYSVLKRILASCAEADYLDVALAVEGQQVATMPEETTL
jgi:biopolymer transport protein ExbD